MAAVVPPPLRLVKALYKNKSLTLAEANEVTKVDAANVNTVAGGNKAINYGEMTPESWSGVLTSLELGTGDMIADLGSGRGALVIQAALECPEVTCIGIELSRKRHTMALGALQRLRQVAEKGSGGSARAAASAAARVAFYCVDMRGCFGEGAANSATDCVAGGVTGSATDNGTDGTLRDVTVVYLMNQDLPSKLVDDVVEALLALARERRGAASSAPPGANPSEERSGDRAADGVLASAASVASAASAASAALVALAPAASLAASPPPPEAGASSGVNCNARGAPARPRRLTLVTLLRLRGFADLRVQRTIDSRQTWMGDKPVPLFVYELGDHVLGHGDAATGATGAPEPQEQQEPEGAGDAAALTAPEEAAAPVASSHSNAGP